MNTAGNINKMKISFPATLGHVDRTVDEIEKLLNEIGLKKKTFSIILGIREALVNAVNHGSGNDEKKSVKLELRLEKKHLLIKVEDEGEGFKWKSCLNKNLPSTEESGRGIAIIRGCFNEVGYNEKGNRLILKCKI